MFGPVRAASASSPSWQVSSLAAWQSTWLCWCQVRWASAGSLLFGLLPEYRPLPYTEPSIPDSPAVFLGLPCVMMARGGHVLCPPCPPGHRESKAASKLWVSSDFVSLSSGSFWELWTLGLVQIH